MVKRVLYTVAHSGFDLGEIALGGGASIGQHLTDEWRRTHPFDLDILGPSILKEDAPREKDLIHYSEMAYARFCQRFEHELTETILQHDPTKTLVLSNDVSEGPDFKRLADRGFSIYTIYHVDVVDYVARIYLHSLVSPESTTAVYRTLTRLGMDRYVPEVLKLVWHKQEASVRYSKGLIVPSRRMKTVLLDCYPGLDPARVHVLPWGMWSEDVSVQEVEREKAAFLQQVPLPKGAKVLLTLSRISPEKGQDRLLRALALYEQSPHYPKEGLVLLIAGDPAYMKGEAFMAMLRRLASTLQRTKVHFVGYVAGARKKALFDLADLYVFPSRHESYGLTLLEALRAGKPVLATPSHGAKDVFQPGFGEMVPESRESEVPRLLMASLDRLLSNPDLLKVLGRNASQWGSQQNFSDTAERFAEVLSHDA